MVKLILEMYNNCSIFKSQSLQKYKIGQTMYARKQIDKNCTFWALTFQGCNIIINANIKTKVGTVSDETVGIRPNKKSV